MATRFLVHFAYLLVGVLLVLPVVAQTQLNLRTQGRNVDFGAAVSTRPLKTGPVLPANCSVGDMFFRSNNPAGKNLFGCTLTDVWTLQGDAAPATGSPNYIQLFTEQTSLSIPAAMHGFDSPNLVVTCFDAASPANVLDPSGVTIDSATFGVTISFSGPRTGRCVLNAPGTSYLSGEGLVQNGAEFSVDPVTVPSFVRGQAVLTAWSIPEQSCVDRPVPLTGAALLDTVVPGWPEDLDASLSGTMLVSTVGTVTIRLCNVSLNPVDVPSRTFTVAILKTF